MSSSLTGASITTTSRLFQRKHSLGIHYSKLCKKWGCQGYNDTCSLTLRHINHKGYCSEFSRLYPVCLSERHTKKRTPGLVENLFLGLILPVSEPESIGEMKRRVMVRLLGLSSSRQTHNNGSLWPQEDIMVYMSYKGNCWRSCPNVLFRQSSPSFITVLLRGML